MKPLHVFVGPSLAKSDLPATLTEVHWHPPIQHGDLFRLAPGPGDRILIIDGVYQHRAPIRHKEIIGAIRAGADMSGAASMGALRAAELGEFGMRGLGTVHEWYASGRLESDADVAVAHSFEDSRFHPVSVALVSLIHSTDWLCAQGELTLTQADSVLRLADELHFAERTEQALRRVAAERGIADEMDRVLRAVAADDPGDVKARDAEAAVRALLADDTAGAHRPTRGVDTVATSSYECQWRLDYSPGDAAGTATLGELLTFARLFLHDYPERHRSYVLDTIRQTTRAAEDHSEAGPCALAAAVGLWPARLSERAELLTRFCSDQERVTASEPELAGLLLVRSFRLRPGNLVYQDFPHRLFEDSERDRLAADCGKALRLDRLAHQRVAQYSAAQIVGSAVDAAFLRLWGVEDIESAVLDRGFRDVQEFRRRARPFMVAARAMAAAHRTAEQS
ncbi:TfuA-like protein [Streptomyces mauvecolor]